MINILIVDSGISKHKVFDGLRVFPTGFRGQDTIEDLTDKVGHGTAVADLVTRKLDKNEVNIHVLRLFDDQIECSPGDLTECLEYVSEHNNYDVINMSFGVTAFDECTEIDELSEIVERIAKQGTIMISAYDNDGAISYPAFFDDVIGVETSKKTNKNTEYEFVMNSCVNILGYGKAQKVAWNNPPYTIIDGNSFASANISNVVAGMLISGVPKADIKNELKKRAINTVDFQEWVRASACPSWLAGSRMITFPFNKEMHSIYAYEDLLTFSIVGSYDVKHKALVGKKVSDILKYTSTGDHIIQNYDDIAWGAEDFDGILVGHVGELSAICKKDLMQEIIEKCRLYGKNIFSFDDIASYFPDRSDPFFREHVFSPSITYDNIPKGRFGKLYSIQMPVIAVVGTSSSQGKYTVQLALRKKLQELSYNVGEIGTEPSAFCFGMDFTYPYGYNSSVYTSGYQNILLLNQALHDIEMKACDICIVGTQTNTALFGYANLNNIPLFQMDFLYGTMPDAFFIVVNPHDEIDYVLRTLRSTEQNVETKCLGIIVYPMVQKQTLGALFRKTPITDEEYNEFASRLREATDIPVCSFDEAMNTSVMVDRLTDFFCSEENEIA